MLAFLGAVFAPLVSLFTWIMDRRAKSAADQTAETAHEMLRDATDQPDRATVSRELRSGKF